MTIRADGEDLSFVTVRVEDAEGNLVPGADNLVRFTVEGAGRVAAVDNGDPASLEPFQAKERKAFSGLALLVVRSNRGGLGRHSHPGHVGRPGLGRRHPAGGVNRRRGRVPIRGLASLEAACRRAWRRA